MSGVTELIGGVLVGLGLALIGLAGLGLLRLPDAYTRMNATGKAGGLGVVCVIAGAALLVADPRAYLTAAVAILLQLVTVPIGSFAIARAAYRASTPLDPSTAYDELSGQPSSRREDLPGPAS